MKSTLSSPRSTRIPSAKTNDGPTPPVEQDRVTRYAFLVLMGSLAAALLYFLILPFTL